MTNLVVPVRINVDGSGVVGQVRQVQSALDQLGASAAEAGAKGKAMAAGTAAAEQAADALAQSARATRAAVDNLADGQRQAGAATRGGASAINEHTKATNSNRNSSMELEHVIRAMSDSVAAGIDPFQALRMEMGRILEVGSMMGGSMKGIAGFLMSGWGMALQAAVAVAVPLVEELFKTDKAMEEVKLGADSLGEAQGILTKMFDLQTGSLKRNTAELLINAAAQAANLRARAAEKMDSGRKALSAGEPGLTNTLLGYSGQVVGAGLTAFGAFGVDDKVNDWAQGKLGGNDDVRRLSDRAGRAFNMASRTDAEQLAQAKVLRRIIQEAELTDFKGSGVDKHGFIQGLDDIVTGRADRATADRIDKTLNTGVLDPALRQEEKDKKPKRPKSTAGLVDFRLSAANEIKNLAAPFEDVPTQAVKAQRAIGQLDLLMTKLQQRKPPGFEGLIEQAKEAERVIRDGIDKPFDDYVKAQLQAFQVGQLILGGKQDEAAAQREIDQLERSIGPLTEAQKGAVLDIAQGMAAQARQLDILRAKQQVYLDALGQMKGIVLDATQAFVRGDLGSIIKTPGKLLDAFETLKGKQLFDHLFDGAFRDLQDQITGTNIVEVSAEKMQDAVDLMTGQTGQAGKAIDILGQVVTRSAQAMDAAAATLASIRAGGGPIAANDNATDLSMAAMLARGNGRPPVVDIHGDPVGKDTVVTAHKPFMEQFAIKITTSIASIFTNKENAESFGKSLGVHVGDAFSGASTGTFVAGIGKAIGINLNGSGSQLGGALGGVLTGIKGVSAALGPLGSLLTPALSIVGGVLGSLFSSVKYGGATITSKGVQGTTGNSGADKAQAVQAANGVLKTLTDIATQLGGTATGDFGTITVGKYGNKYRVNDHGTNLKSNNDVNQYDTLEEAQTFAIDTALARGAIQGISAAVQKALTNGALGDESSRLKEALKVGDLETLLGGVQASLKKIFDTEAASAKERLRLAQTYGLDIAATEKANAAQLSKLIASTMKAATGSLQSVLDDMASGDLFEGSAFDRRDALLGKIADAKNRADAGEDGAADQLATLYRNLLSTDKDAFGTAGPELTSDRALVRDGAAEVIKAEQDRINQAAGIQATIADNTAKTAASADESNDQLATISSTLSQLLAATTNGAGDYAQPATNYRLTQFGADY